MHQQIAQVMGLSMCHLAMHVLPLRSHCQGGRDRESNHAVLQASQNAHLSGNTSSCIWLLMLSSCT